MKYCYYHKLFKFYSFLESICIFQLIINVSPELNYIIRLSDNNFIYNHISINSKGDMLIDTSSSSSRERKFYGLKKNGAPFFGNSFYKTLSVDRNSDYGRSEGEVLFIKYTKNYDYSNIEECIVYIPQKSNNYVEYYLFDENVVYYSQTNSDNFENIESSRFSAFKLLSDDETNLDYIFSYVYNGKINIFQGNFDYYNTNEFSKTDSLSIESAKALMISCYCTKKKIYICFYLISRKYKYSAFIIPLKKKKKSMMLFIQ